MRSIGTWWHRHMVAGLSALMATSALACSATDSELGTTESEDALTLADGDRYVVTADAESGRVVLRTEVDGVPLPYDQRGMLGKAVLIHPLAGRAERGVFARVVDVRANEAVDQLELTTTPLTLEAMSALSEDEILRIYLTRATEADGSGLRTRSLHLLDTSSGGSRPPPSSGWTGLLPGGFPMPSLITPNPGLGAFVGAVGLARPPTFAFSPEGKLSFSREAGLEIGLRGTMSATLAIDLHGTGGGRAPLFMTPEARLPPLSVLVPIGPVPVPVQLVLSSSMRCDIVAGGTIDGVVTLSAKLRFGGSARFRPQQKVPPAQWLTAGEWPYELDADFDADLEGKLDPGAGLECVAPRVNLDVAIAGIAGPYVAVVPQVTTLADRIEVRPSLRAGWSSQALLFGSPARAEFELLAKATTYPR